MSDKQRAYHLTMALALATWGYILGNQAPGYGKEAVIILMGVTAGFLLYLWVPLLYKMGKYVVESNE